MRWFLIFILFISMKSFAQSVAEIRRIMNPQNSLYDVLGIGQNASDKEIRSAFRSLMRSYHPDLHQNSDWATAVMKKLNESRDTLMDPVKRQKYDLTVKVTPPPRSQSQAQSKAQAYSRATADQNKWSNSKKWTPEDFNKPQASKDAPTSSQGRKAQKSYESTAKCGTGYFKPFVDYFL